MLHGAGDVAQGITMPMRSHKARESMHLNRLMCHNLNDFHTMFRAFTCQLPHYSSVSTHLQSGETAKLIWSILRTAKLIQSILQEPYGLGVDIWAMGVTLLELWSTDIPVEAVPDDELERCLLDSHEPPARLGALWDGVPG